MAKTQDHTVAECIGIEEYTDSKGEIRQSFDFILDGNHDRPFRVQKTRYFTPTVGKFYTPILGVIERAKVSPRTNTPYIEHLCGVLGWQEVN